MATTSRLGLDKTDVRRARTLARQVGRPIVKLAQQHTTVSVERATLRLAGLAGADPDGTPWVNRLLDVVRADVGLEHGVALPVWHALRRGHADDLLTLAQKASTGSVVSSPAPAPPRPSAVETSSRTGPTLTAAGRRLSETSTRAARTSAGAAWTRCPRDRVTRRTAAGLRPARRRPPACR